MRNCRIGQFLIFHIEGFEVIVYLYSCTSFKSEVDGRRITGRLITVCCHRKFTSMHRTSTSRKKVFEKLESLCENQKPIAIFIICTHLPKEYKVLLIPLDALLFEQLATLPAIQIVFTNPATVEPTMARYQLWQPENQHVTIHIIPNVFQYIEQGKWEEYTQEILTAIAQLSMECAIRASDYSCLTALPKTVQKLKSFA